MNTDINNIPHSTKADDAQNTKPLSSDRSNSAPKATIVSGIQVYSSQHLFGSANEIGIEHQNSFYRLRITRQGKLILNK